MPFHWPVSYCFSEHTCRPSHTTQPWCAFGCTSRKILNTTDICLTAARGQMRAELMRTRGFRALPMCAASRNRPIALPGELVCGRLKQRQRHESTRRSAIRVDENNQPQQRQRHVRRSTDRDVTQELTRDDTQRDDNEWRVESRRRSTQNRRTPGQCAKCGESNTSLPGANTLDMYNVENVASWATKINITHGTRRSANTIWPLELLTPIIYVQGIIRTITLCTDVSSGHALLTLW